MADAWWIKLVKQEIALKLTVFVGSEEEKASITPDEFESQSDAFAFINLLGNCSLLDKSFNISKGEKPMWTFLQEVHEFKKGVFERSKWEKALELSSTLTDPTGATLASIKEAVQARDAAIRNELREFIAGNKHRID